MIAPSAALAESVGGNLDLRWTATTLREGVFKSDIPAFFAKKVENLRLKDLTVDWADAIPAYFSEGLRIEEFKDLAIDGFEGRQAQADSGAAILLMNGSGISITNSRALPGTRVFTQMDKVLDRRVFVNYDLSGAAKVIVPPDMRFDTQIALPSAKARPSSHSHSAAAQAKP